LFVDLGGEGIDAGTAHRDGGEELGHLLIEHPHVRDHDRAAALRALAAGGDGALQVVGEGAVLVFGEDAVAHRDQHGGAAVEVPRHQRMRRAISRNSSVSALPRSWKASVSVALTTAPAWRSCSVPRRQLAWVRDVTASAPTCTAMPSPRRSSAERSTHTCASMPARMTWRVPVVRRRARTSSTPQQEKFTLGTGCTSGPTGSLRSRTG